MTLMASEDLVAQWQVPLSDGIYLVEFEHGTTTGKRIIRVNGKEIYRQDWLFKLVGVENFAIGKKNTKCAIMIQASDGFTYEYSLEVNGKPLEKFAETRSKIQNTWCLPVEGVMTRIVLEKDTLDVWVNGHKVETTGEFTDDGTETHFTIGDRAAYIKAVSSGKRREGIIHSLVVDDAEIPPSRE
ncbi:fas apoptotic inhibitory molecule 1-like [Watersipora subatra]|uniref:fas apoptotic inhibitory molecule 1-like n=1 Tax=Watersipora subatra TaxID=2589382 RepID=UPI00355B26EF